MVQAAACIPDAHTQLVGNWRGCTDGGWLQRLTEHVPGILSEAPMLIDIGANKGIAAPVFLSTIGTHSTLSVRSWSDAIADIAHGRKPLLGESTPRQHGFLKAQLCGACNECGRRHNLLRHALSGAHVHLIELTKANFDLLRSLVNATGSSDVISVHHLAASNESALVRSAKVRLGTEYTTVLPLSRTSSNGAWRVEDGTVEQVTFDAFLRRQQLDRRVIDVVHVDTEGHDALVLEGMRDALHARRITLLEFEYSGRGYWSSRRTDGQRSLHATLLWLSDTGYRCYMEAVGNKTQAREALAPISGECWRAEFETRRWSNVLCTHEARAVEVLERSAWAAYEQRSEVQKKD